MKKGILLSIAAILLLFSFCNGQTRAKLTGYITDCQSGEPLQGVAVSADESDPVYSDENGEYTLNITNGIYDLTFSLENYVSIFFESINLTGLMTLDTCMSNGVNGPFVSPEEIYAVCCPGWMHFYEVVSISHNLNQTISWYSEVELIGGWSETAKNEYVELWPSEGTIPPGEIYEVGIDFDLREFEHNWGYWGPKEALITFISDDMKYTNVLYCNIDYFETSINSYSGRPIKISPNPASDKIQLNDTFLHTCNFQILSHNGKKIDQGTLLPTENTINVESLPPGIYILKLEDENHQVSVGKFVKQ